MLANPNGVCCETNLTLGGLGNLNAGQEDMPAGVHGGVVG